MRGESCSSSSGSAESRSQQISKPASQLIKRSRFLLFYYFIIDSRNISYGRIIEIVVCLSLSLCCSQSLPSSLFSSRRSSSLFCPLSKYAIGSEQNWSINFARFCKIYRTFAEQPRCFECNLGCFLPANCTADCQIDLPDRVRLNAEPQWTISGDS